MNSEPTIQLLSDQVANNIAAGEVVERPASVVKELVENAVDAGATRIEVEVVSGGRKLIRIADNGHGMSRDNALLSIERHATSKIRSVDDIEHISTMGFRGEALAAIASVSRFELVTRRSDDLEGTQIVVSGGKILEDQTTGCPPGTAISVRNLFFNVPARKKFLKTEQTEMVHIRKMFTTLALAHLQIGMTLISDGRTLFQLPPAKDMKHRIMDLYGTDLAKGLHQIHYEKGHTQIYGYAGSPALHRKDRSHQFTFVNGRPANAPVVFRGISEAYRTLLRKEQHPLLFLHIHVPPETVDVNVHPMKREVRFRHAGEVRDHLMDALQQALTHKPGEPVSPAPSPEPSSPAERPTPSGIVPSRPSLSFPSKSITPEESIEALNRTERPTPVPISSGRPTEQEIPLPSQEDTTGPWKWCIVHGITKEGFGLLELEDGIATLDVRAAHERVLYEKYTDQMSQGTVPSQGLFPPQTVELDPEDALLLSEHLETLIDHGIHIATFDGNTFVVEALPALFLDVDPEAILSRLAYQIKQAGGRNITKRALEEQVGKSVAYQAVYYRESLPLNALEQLVRDLARCTMPYTSPTGRPTLIFTSNNELKRKFKRSN